MANPEVNNPHINILQENNYSNLINHLKNQFNQDFPGIDFKDFMNKSDHSGYEKRIYDTYQNKVNLVPIFHDALTKTEKNVSDYDILIENKLWYLAQTDVDNYKTQSDSYKEKLQLKEFEDKWNKNYENFIDFQSLSNQDKITLIPLINHLNTLSNTTIEALTTFNQQKAVMLHPYQRGIKKVETTKTIEEKIHHITLDELGKIWIIWGLIRFFPGLKNQFKQAIQEIAQYSYKNQVVDINRYYTVSVAETSLTQMSKRNSYTADRFIDSESNLNNFQIGEVPYYDEMEVFLQKHSQKLYKAKFGKINDANKDQIIKNAINDLEAIINTTKDKVWYTPWELTQFKQDIESLNQNKKLYEFLKLFRSYLASWVQDDTWADLWINGNREDDDILIQELDDIIKRVKNGDSEYQSIEDIFKTWFYTVLDTYGENRISDFYDFLIESFKESIINTYEVENSWASAYNDDTENIDIFLNKFHFEWRDQFNFDKLKVALATKMAEAQWFQIDQTNTYEAWNLMREDVISQMDKNLNGLVQSEINAYFQEQKQDFTPEFSAEEDNLFRRELYKIPSATKEQILISAWIAYEKWNIADVEDKLFSFIKTTSREAGLLYACEQSIVEVMKDQPGAFKSWSLNNHQIFLEKLYDSTRDIKELAHTLARETMIFAISAAVTGWAWALMSVFAHAGRFGAAVWYANSAMWKLTTLKQVGWIKGFAAKSTLGTIRVASDVANYTLLSNFINDGEFSLDHFMDNFALIGWGIAWLTIWWTLYKWSSQIKKWLSKYLWASSGSFSGSVMVHFNNGEDIDLVGLLKQSAIMWAMMLPMSLGRKAWIKSANQVQHLKNLHSPWKDRLTNKIKHLDKRADIRQKNIDDLNIKLKNDTQTIFNDLKILRDENVWVRVWGPRIWLEKTQYLKTKYNALDDAYFKYKNLEQSGNINALADEVTNIFSRYNITEVSQLKTLLSKKKTEFWSNPKNTNTLNELRTLERDYALLKAINSKQWELYFTNKLIDFIDDAWAVDLMKIANLPPAHPIKRLRWEIAEHSKLAGTHLKKSVEKTIEWVPMKVLQSRRNSAEFNKYASEWKRILDNNYDYHGINMITDKQAGNLLKYKGETVLRIPKWDTVKSAKTFEVKNRGDSITQMYMVTMKTKSGKSYDIKIMENGGISETMSKLALQERWTLSVVRKNNWDVWYYVMKTKSQDGTEIFTTYSKDWVKFDRNTSSQNFKNKQEVVIDAMQVVPKAKDIKSLKDRRKELAEKLFKWEWTKRQKAAQLLWSGTKKAITTPLKYPKTTIFLWSIGWGYYYINSWTATEHLNEAKSYWDEKVNQAIDTLIEKIASVENIEEFAKENAAELIEIFLD